mgnify:CR=1 FL=1
MERKINIPSLGIRITNKEEFDQIQSQSVPTRIINGSMESPIYAYLHLKIIELKEKVEREYGVNVLKESINLLDVEKFPKFKNEINEIIDIYLGIKHYSNISITIEDEVSSILRDLNYEGFEFGYEESPKEERIFRLDDYVKVQGKKIVIFNHNEYKEHLMFLALALKRNLQYPKLPYFSAEDLKRNEIIIQIQDEHNPRYIKCGNIVIRNSIVSVYSKGVSLINYRKVWEQARGQEVVDICNETLDMIEADFARTSIIDEFLQKCQELDPTANYRIEDIRISHVTLFDHHEDKYSYYPAPPKNFLEDEIRFYLVKSDDTYVTIETSFDGLKKMDVEQFLSISKPHRMH